MNSGDYKYIWQASDWPDWRFDLTALAGPMAEVSRAQGVLMGRLADVGMALHDQASLAALTEDVVKTSEIEGEQLSVESVRSSIARRLGVDIGALAPVDRHVESVVEMVLDATANCHALVSRERLFGWHAALFPLATPVFPRSRSAAGVTIPVARCRWCLARSAGGVCISRHRQPTVWTSKPAVSSTG
jgi:Fic family protein